jgi:hypothetical protein
MAKLYPSDVWRMGDSLDPMEKLVALALLDYGDRIFPSQAHVAVKTGLSLATVKRVMKTLRSKMVITTKRTKRGLAYGFVMAHPEPRHSVTQTPPKCQPDTGMVSHRATNYPKNSPTQPRAADAAPAGGWDLSWEVRSRIGVRDPRGDPDAQLKVARRLMREHGLSDADAQWGWRLLCEHWARTGNAPYDTLHRITTSLEGARDVRAVVMHKLKGVAA